MLSAKRADKVVNLMQLATLPEEEQSYIKAEEVKMEKAALYLSIQQWFAENLGKSNEALQIQDKEAGILLGRIIMPNGMRDALGVRHDLQVNVKIEPNENKYRISISEFTLYCRGPGRFLSPGKEYHSALESASKPASYIFKHVNTTKSNSSF
ncbi:MAG: hypothetical protein ACJAUP_003748 [Cellvibrionaceae bacterium]